MITHLQIHHVFRLVKQILINPDFAIVGGYHGANLGDIALGESVALILKDMNYQVGLQTIYNIDRWPWPTSKYYIIGGGAVGYTSSLLKLKSKITSNKDLAFLGVDFNETTYTDEIINMLREAKWISCRNEYQANFVTSITKRMDVTYHPDLVFSYKQELCEKLRNAAKKKLLLVNVVPLYGKVINGSFLPNETYKSERPELYANYPLLIDSYKKGLQSVVKKALKEGYKVETIPFEPDDELAAKALLEDLPVLHNKYFDNVEKMTRKIGEAEMVFATRYHATILSIKTGAKIIPMAYASKNNKLLNELNINNEYFLSSSDLALGKDVFPDPIFVDIEVVRKWEKMSIIAIKSCINNLLNN